MIGLHPAAYWVPKAPRRPQGTPGVVPTAGTALSPPPGSASVDLLSGQELTPTQLLASIAMLTGGSIIPRPQSYEQLVRKYGTVVWVYRACNLNAQNFAAIPFVTMINDQPAPKTDPLAMLLSRVNPFMTAYDLWEVTSMNLDLVGNNYWLLFDGASGLPEEIWPARPDRMEILGHPSIGIQGYRYRTPRGAFDFRRESVIHVRYQNPWHDFYGQGALSPTWSQADAFEQATTYRRHFYANSARPDGVLRADGFLSDEQITMMREQWQAQHLGVEKAHRIAVLHSGLKYDRVAATPRDAMIVKDLELSREDILVAFGVPLAAAGIETGDIGRRREQILNYREGTIKPRGVKVAATLTEFLAPRFSPAHSVRPDFTDFIRESIEDEAKRRNTDRDDVKAGILTQNELRKARGLSPIPWGDEWWIPVSMMPAGELGYGPGKTRPGTMPEPGEPPALSPPDEDRDGNGAEDEMAKHWERWWGLHRLRSRLVRAGYRAALPAAMTVAQAEFAQRAQTWDRVAELLPEVIEMEPVNGFEQGGV